MVKLELYMALNATLTPDMCSRSSSTLSDPKMYMAKSPLADGVGRLMEISRTTTSSAESICSILLWERCFSLSTAPATSTLEEVPAPSRIVRLGILI